MKYRYLLTFPSQLFLERVTNLHLPTMHQHHMQPAPHSQHNDQQRLDGMYNQGKDTGIGGTDTIKHHHGDDGKVPRACPVGRRYNHGKSASHKHHQPGQETKVRRKIKTEKGKVEVQEIANPDAHRITHKKRHVAHTTQGHHSLPNSHYNPLNLIVHREQAQQVVEQHDYPHPAQQDDVKPHRSKQMHQRRDFGTCFLKKTHKDRHLQQEGDCGNEQDTECIEQAFGNNCPQRFDERHIVVA